MAEESAVNYWEVRRTTVDHGTRQKLNLHPSTHRNTRMLRLM